MPTALWISPVSDLAGVARHILDVARTGIPGWRVVVACPAGPLADALHALDTEVHTLDVDQPIPKVVADLRRIITDVQPELVHSHLARADVLVALAAPRDLTLISTEHHVQADQRIFHGNALKAQAKVGMHRARLRRFNQLIAVSDSTKRDLIRHWKPQAPVTVVLNGVDRPEFQQERTPGLRLLSLTRLSPEKNVETALRVFERVRKTHPEATLTVGGTGVEEESLRALAAELGIADAVDFAGFIDPREAMAEHDVLLQPSLADNLSYTLLDAVAFGMGVAASDIGGNGEILPTRCLAGPTDVEALASVVLAQGLNLAERPELPNSIPTVSQMCDEIAEVYAQAGHGNPRLSEAMQTFDSAGSPQMSVVTAYYKNNATLGEQLDALVAQEDAPQFEVVIADNEGSALLPYLIAPYRNRLDIRIVPASDIAGQCHARNVGVAAARGAHIAMTDADDLVGPRWLSALHELLNAGDVLATGPMRLDRVNSEFVCAAKAELDGLPEVPRPYQQLPFGYLDYKEFVFGSNIGVRRSSYLAIGGMNEGMLGGSEDVDFTWRWLESGREIAISPDAVVDYRLRAKPYDVMTQAYRYQRAQLGLWRRSQAMGRPVRGMSLRWALEQNAKLPLAAWQWLRGDAHERYVIGARAGGMYGNLIGQIAVRGPWWHAPVEGVMPVSLQQADSSGPTEIA